MTTNIQSNDCNLVNICSVLKQNLRQIKLRYGVKSLGVFGSFVREEATEHSDLDILVEFEDVPTFRKYMDLKFFLEDLFSRRVDLVIQSDIKPQIREQILREVVYVS
ncbi:nucleotidyltransferase family protein [Spirulina subsalsa FACHB-351]|uniref:Nucleotidyltransferase family protein n=2 Tax=Spirulina subsalsa TaxID=54311 RepID=A0ABT3L7V8_9CYAN|nr:nucleotidyltransferase family protein [Spirulina subsalsa FACHB-351]